MFEVNFEYMKLNLLICLLILTVKFDSVGQSLQIFGVDTKQYPYVKSNVYLLDSAGKLIKNINQKDIQVVENGEIKKTFDFICPPNNDILPISAVLCFDISESMNHDDRLTNARNGIYQWINSMNTAKDEAALTGFADIAILYSDFTNDSLKIRKSIDRIFVREGTNFNEGFLNPKYGCLEIATKAKNKPIIIFLTDGIGTGDESKIVAKANSLEARVFTITIGLEAPDILKNISSRTGGICFNNINSNNDLHNAFEVIKKNAQSVMPCSFSWLSSGCISEKEVEFTYLPLGLKTNISFKGIDSLQAKFEISPDRYLIFSPSSNEKIITIKAKNAPIDIENIKLSDPKNFSWEWVDSFPKFTLKKDSDFKIKIRSTNSDSSFNLCIVEIIASTCVGNQFYCVSGNPGVTPRNGSIKILQPNGGEEYVAKSKESIIWNGTNPNLNSLIEFTIDGGQRWALIDSTAKGNAYLWNLPDVSSQQCKVRVTQFAKDYGRLLFSINTDSISVNSLAWSPEGSYLLSGMRDSSFAIYDAINGNMFWKLKSHNGQVKAVTWSPDGIRFATASEDSTIKIYNVFSKQIIDSIVGFGASINSISWSPNNDYIICGGLDSLLYIVNANDFKIFKKINLTNSEINYVKYSPKAKYIGIASSDNMVRIFNSFDYSIQNVLIDNDLQYKQTQNGPALSLAFNSNSTKVVTSGKDYKVRVWDISAPNNSFLLNSNPNHVSSVNSVDWNPKSNLIASTGLDSKVLIWKPDITSVFSFNGSWEHTSVVFSPDGTRVAASYVGINIPEKIDVYSIDIFPLQRAVSDNVFSILKPVFNQKSITFGDVKINGSNEITISSFYSYNLKSPIDIDSIKILNDANNSFDIVYTQPSKLSINLQYPITFFFRPKVAGVCQAKIISYTSIGEFTSDIKGKGIELILKPIDNDFGEVVIGDSLEKNIALLKNNSNNQINIENFNISGPDYNNFSLFDKSTIFPLNSTEVKSLSVKFKPTEKMRFLSSIKFQTVDDSVFSFLSGVGVKPILEIVSNLDFGSTFCNDSACRNLKISNKGSGLLKITDIKISSGLTEFVILDTFKTMNIFEGKDTIIKLKFQPTNRGQSIGELTLVSNAFNSKNKETKVNLLGKKEEIDFSLNQNLIEFKNIVVGQSETKVFSILNNSTIPLFWGTNFPINILAGRFQIISITPNLTLPNESSIVTVKFNGGTKGEIVKTDYKFLDTCGTFKSIDLKAYVLSDNPRIVSVDTIKFKDLLCEIDTNQANIEFGFSNNGGETLEIFDMFFTGNDKSYFKIDGQKKFQVIKGGNDFTNIKFNPTNASQARDYTALLNIKTNDPNANKSDSVIQIPIVIIKYNISFVTSTSSIDFRFVGTLNPGIKYFEIKNTGNFPLKWDKIPNLNLFKIKILPPITQVGSSSTVSVEYIGSAPTTILTNILKLEDTCSQKINVQLKVLPADIAQTTIKIGSYNAKIGEDFSLPIYLQNSSNLTQTNLQGLELELKMNSTVLNCNDFALVNSIDSTIRTIKIPINLSKADDGLIYKVPLKALWGNDSISTISIKNIKAIGKNVSAIEFDTINGIVYITDLCKNGGTRFFFRDKPISLNFNMLNDDIKIDYNLIEDGYTELYIYDLKGNKVLSLESNEMKIGAYSTNLNSKSIMQGKYFIVLKTKSNMISKSLNLIH